MKDDRYDLKCKKIIHCKCGHSVDYYKNHDYIICTLCGSRIYKDDKTKFQYEMRRILKCQCGNI